jgi:hypothetical protein
MRLLKKVGPSVAIATVKQPSDPPQLSLWQYREKNDSSDGYTGKGN